MSCFVCHRKIKPGTGTDMGPYTDKEHPRHELCDPRLRNLAAPEVIDQGRRESWSCGRCAKNLGPVDYIRAVRQYGEPVCGECRRKNGK